MIIAPTDADRHKERVGWILYDDSCGFCRRWVPFWGETLRKRGFDIAPLQAEWVLPELHLSEADLLADLRLLLVNGEQIQGADVYRYAMKRIWWAYPVFLLSIAPVCRRIFDWSYRAFALHRHEVSRACNLPGGVEHVKPNDKASPGR
jgi:predicted DCC family thiol-disulfide oxidoreductase YuxK